MQNDDIVWSIINRSFCSFKVSTSTQNFCRETNNVTGLCSRTSCPLANSQYATVREEKGICYLYIKTAERHYFPVKQWEKIKLSKNFKTALRQIDENLILYKKYFRQKCRQRLLKLTQVLVRMRKQALDPEKKLIPIRRKIDLRIKRREQKALVAAKTDLAIEKKLLERLKEGVYGGIYNFCPTAFEEVTKEAEEEKEVESYKVVGGEREEEEGEKSKIKKKVMKIMDKEIEQEEEEEEEEDEEVEEREFVADFEESENEEDIEDIEGQYIRYLSNYDGYDEDEDDDHDDGGDERYDDSDEESTSSPSPKKRKLDKKSSKDKLNNISKVKKLLRKPKVKIEYEEDLEEEPVMQRQKLKVRA